MILWSKVELLQLVGLLSDWLVVSLCVCVCIYISLFSALSLQPTHCALVACMAVNE